ncbi:4-hydroxybutyrate CoA-transferase [Intrasporangium oryzae NRRL B-24470]|uniref:4-hydroxybutyrate CoA-transferase n=1 Tax=Intrasporangium oryzae NRRL B-24470 TaxID=1386089 RepID=W9GBY9_9MICO|nr:acetyl-CoA hydrolase/transferase C-terminal domain-containing protein [Intrasporangium oryzae]EWT03560.1 4-hydroxybutyrate CoA-transferase [Intrasporangium oryzae NRRL B-24470]
MQTVTIEELQRRFRSLPENPRVVVSGNMAIPWEGVRALDEVVPAYVLHALNAPPGLPEREGVTVETCFVGGGMRRHPGLRYVPSRLSLVPLLYGRSLPPDAVILHCAPPVDGQLSLGLEVNVMPAAIEACRARGGLVVAVVNPRMPYTFGDAQVPVGHVDLAVEVDAPLASHAPGAPDPDSTAIGERVASMVLDGATLQLGIGAVPDATLAALVTRRGLRVWTEMFSDGILDLEAAGALDREHPLVTSFCFGSQDLYDWLDGNRWVRMMRTERTNDPGSIAQQRQMTSVNTALEVDLFGQANASRINARIFSGFGGQTDFIVGALHSPGGQSFIALRSWHPKADCSTIVPLVDEPVTSFQQSAIVTENGVAQLWGRSEKEQCRDIIEQCAHASVRDDLWEEATALGLA